MRKRISLIYSIVLMAIFIIIFFYKWLIKDIGLLGLNETVNHLTFLVSTISIFIGIIYSGYIRKNMISYLSFGMTRRKYLKNYFRSVIFTIIVLFILNIFEIIINRVLFYNDKLYIIKYCLKAVDILSLLFISSILNLMNGNENDTIKKRIIAFINILIFIVGILVYFINNLLFNIIILLLGITIIFFSTSKIIRKILKIKITYEV